MSCLHPVVLDSGARYACGKCFGCRQDKARSIRLKIDSEMRRCGNVAVFDTLTYSPENLHYVQWVEGVQPNISLLPYRPSYEYAKDLFGSVQNRLIKHLEYFEFRKYLYHWLHLRHLPRNGAEAEDMWLEAYLSDNVEIANKAAYLRYLFPSYNDGALIPTFPLHFDEKTNHVSTPIQRYMKILRRKMDTLPDKPHITYYCVEEYGPRTFRPHHHIILFCDNCSIERLRELNKTVFIPLWESLYGSVQDGDAVRCANSTATYVSKYVAKPIQEENPYEMAGFIKPVDCMRFHSQGMAADISARMQRQFDVLKEQYSDVIDLPFCVPVQKTQIVHPVDYKEVVFPDGRLGLERVENDMIQKAELQFEPWEDYLNRLVASFSISSRLKDFLEKLYEITHYWICDKEGVPISQVSYSPYLQKFWPQKLVRFRDFVDSPENAVRVVEPATGEVHDVCKSHCSCPATDIRKGIYNEVIDDAIKSLDDLPDDFSEVELVAYPRARLVKDTSSILWQSYLAYCATRHYVRVAEELRAYAKPRYESEWSTVSFDQIFDQFTVARGNKFAKNTLSKSAQSASRHLAASLQRNDLSDLTC